MQDFVDGEEGVRRCWWLRGDGGGLSGAGGGNVFPVESYE